MNTAIEVVDDPPDTLTLTTTSPEFSDPLNFSDKNCITRTKRDNEKCVYV